MSSFYQPPTIGRKIVHPFTASLYNCCAGLFYGGCMAVIVYLLMVWGL